MPLVISLALVAGLLALPGFSGRAEAAFPGANGKIAYNDWDTSTNHYEGDIYVVNPDGTGRTNLTNAVYSEFNTEPAWSADGTRIAFVHRSAEPYATKQIYVMNADGSGKTNLSQNSVDNANPTWSPDGTKIAFISSGGLWVMNSDGSGKRLISSESVRSPSWSPDGTQIAVERFGGATAGATRP